jgi:prolipoprotein diacylglyceryltransferase
LFALYVAGYCAFRIVDELLRVDPAAHVFGLRWNLLLAIAGTAIGVAWFAATQRGGQHRPTPPAPVLTPR